MQKIESIVCWACGMEISSQDNYCRSCGKGQGKRIPWYYKQWGIIVLTFLALGPFSIIFVWKSPSLSRGAKWINTAVITVLTCYAAYRIYNLWLAFSTLFASMTGMGGGF